MTRREAILVLEDGRTLRGEAYGSVGETFGEAVFNTGMTGYQETLTDPSYHRQVVVQTAPHIGNTGVNDEDDESARIWVAGYAVRDPARLASNWRGLDSTARGHQKKTAHSWRVSGGLSALAHEPAQTTNAGKTKTESKPQKRKEVIKW